MIETLKLLSGEIKVFQIPDYHFFELLLISQFF